jgi:serine kinase of HPr protein (carbohydrate metabolism regulator)
MGFFTRKSKWDRVRGMAMKAAADHMEVRGLSKVTAGLVAGAVAVTAASAAVSAIRQPEQE